ncbi:pesticin C-terminus-like muramidase [Pseudomonas sp. FP2309]|uniref:pesticin C-terminus-like muramidase n=1 Tax=Pseudomonas sp. FP2309 TaxID=2954091 RepID=UPI0027323106|nr:pesticin C-terminus-like muramidase [Pseudomonas sp. FP2309]WLH69394.1 pesticin C-terminus-like muramidase [Pseudomonas sp. FP2309]
MANLFSRTVDLLSPDRKEPIYVSAPPTRQTSPAPSQPLTQTSDSALTPLRNWSHPFKDKTNPLLQLTQMAKAVAGYYPLGRNGLWHAGVHFDSGTAGTLDQSRVHCLADGEVVAYRIDELSPTTTYFVEKLCVSKPFSRNFVLVRHRLEAPRIEGSPDVPPSLVFYSLYMHLQDWAIYRNDPSIPRQTFWPEGRTRRVKTTVRDVRAGTPEQRGLNVRNQAQGGKVLALLPRGAEVTVSGQGEYRKLENTNGPDVLKNTDGSLLGFLSVDYLVPIVGDEYRVKADPSLRVRAEANTSSAVLMELPDGTEVTVSGEGRFRKLERVNQYVHFNSLEGALEPIADRIVVLDQPIAIKAGDLIGHIGEYQDGNAEHPEKKLHLEAFSDDHVEPFVEASRAWAQRLPAASKTWLKFSKGSAVVTHQERFNATQPPTLSAASTPSDADLLVPKSLIDGLPADKKIVVTATPDRSACNWYRLDGLFHDANRVLLDGWVREEVGVTPWVSPWSWEGYDVIFNYDSPQQTLASFFRAAGRFNEEQLERHGPWADMSDKGPMKSRLYDIIDRDRDGKMTAKELQAAIVLPAHAQSLSQLIILYESEWRHAPHKWDALDEVLGHSSSTPLLNWLAEKERIKEISWWNEVAAEVGLPVDGRVYHLHPIGLAMRFNAERPKECVPDVYELEGITGTLTVSKESFQFILDKEGYSRYPYVPAGASGVTLGFGYDLGQQTIAQVRNDLAQIYSQSDIDTLIAAIGRQGIQARDILSSLNHISISKENAISLAVKMKKRYAQLVIEAYPGAMNLHPHCQGALLSLVVNRGTSFSRPDLDSRLEMKQISEDLLNLAPEKIPSRLRSMKRLWEGKAGLGGVIIRREEEAKLFERGLTCDCWQ